ncbi:MAG: diguanylate cyclase [Solirubrobacteraceae bacterium]
MLRASQWEALTDALTHLGNRRRLSLDLEQALRSAAQEPRILALFDLNGFKFYNDTFGHPAGDALLARLGRQLDTSAARTGRAYRMGGDEFCVLATLGAEHPETMIAEWALALSDQGDGFSITCAYGWCRLPDDAADATAALHIADQAMYRNKQRSPSSPARQSMDVLVAALQQRDGALGSHGRDVAHLAERVAQQLGLPAEAIELTRQGAELHDIGKVAIPDAILNKPGPLDDDEWAFIRRHTLIGETIIAAAPALIPVAKLVRSTHERVDGTGYPDALQGPDIPISSRIIAVCDAFDAMASDRSYSPPMTVGAALAELQRCAGTQFDPEVVDALMSLAEITPDPNQQTPTTTHPPTSGSANPRVPIRQRRPAAPPVSREVASGPAPTR